MNALLPLIEQAIVNGVLDKKAPFMRKNKFGVGFAALSALLFIMALIFAVISLHGWLLTYYLPPVAALIVAGVVLGFSLITGAIGYMFLKSRAKPGSPHEAGDDVTKLLGDVTALVEEELSESVRENPKTAVLLASLAGFVAGEHLH